MDADGALSDARPLSRSCGIPALDSDEGGPGSVKEVGEAMKPILRKKRDRY